MNSKETVFCNQNFMEFYRQIQDIAPSVDETFFNLKNAMTFITDDLHIGKGTMKLIAPATPLCPAGINDTREFFYASSFNQDIKAEFSYPTGENGKVVITFYGAGTEEWNEVEYNSLEFIASFIYTIVGRSRTMDLLRKSFVTDFGTGAANSIGIMNYGMRLSSAGQLGDFSCIFLNLRNFKYVNKQIGYNKANDVLRIYTSKVAAQLSSLERIGRMGGDNFIILVHKKHLSEILSFIEEVPVEVVKDNGEKIVFQVRCIAGVCDADDQMSMEDLSGAASIAFQTAKKNVTGGFYMIFQKEMYTRMFKEKEVAMSFNYALTHGEFVPFYQPKVLLKNNQLCGAEALCRWFHDGKMVSPMDFVPVLERDGSVCRLDFYILEQVCKDIRRWIDADYTPVKVSVNFSRWHLLNPNISEEILDVIHRYDIDPCLIEIEITETANNEDFIALAKMINTLKKSGMTFSVDDFGTGFSSLSLLKNLSADVLKIDKSFLDVDENYSFDDQQDKRNKILFENIIRIANGLNMEVICEGVETTEQKEFLLSLDCDMAQGYYYDKPLPVEQFEKYLTKEYVYNRG